VARRPASARFTWLTGVHRLLQRGDRRAPDAARFRSLVVLYKASGDYRKLADSTKRNWSRWLDRISDHFGTLRVAQFDRPDKIRPVIRRWRNQWADKPRSADYAMQVLSRVLSHAVDPLGRIAGNPCKGIKQLYSADRSEIIWLAADITHLKATCSADVGFAVAGSPEGGTGRRFFTKDHRADLTIQSVPNHGNASPAEFLQKRRPPPGIQYKRVTPRFFAVSSIRNGRTWYNRCNRADGYMHCVLINYPAAEDRQWDAIVTRISLSLAE